LSLGKERPTRRTSTVSQRARGRGEVALKEGDDEEE